MPDFPQQPRAVVIGLCAHGLSIVRSLHGAGVCVIALDANPSLPGLRTRCAQVRIVPDINGDGLIDALLELARESGDAPRAVLMLTNDRMVEVVGRHAQTISRYFRLCWSQTAASLLTLLEKHGIEGRCAEVGLNYPKSVLLKDFGAARQALADLRFPVIAKPTRPVSAFKTHKSTSIESFLDARVRMETSMPIVVQEFIPGDDTVIRFGALYLNAGKVLARFEGRKLRSRPMGHTTIAIPEPNDEVHSLTLRFFAGLKLSGPVSLELKQDPDGHYWVIEPTVGRTDFWVGLCAANEVDLTLIEYRAQCGEELAPAVQRTSHLWLNGERDPGALAWLLRYAPGALFGHRLRGVYFSLSDPMPWLASLGRFVGALPARAVRKFGRLLASRA